MISEVLNFSIHKVQTSEFPLEKLAVQVSRSPLEHKF